MTKIDDVASALMSHNNNDPKQLYRGRFQSFAFAIKIDEQGYLIKIVKGRVESVVPLEKATEPPAFTFSPAVPAGGGTITHADGTTTAITGGATSVPYKAGDTYVISGVSFQISGQPANGDQFTIAANTNAAADNRNVLAMGNLQTATTVSGTMCST